MSDEVKEPAVPAAEEAAADEAVVVKAEPEIAEPKKSVKFETNELTFDEAQAEIDAIKARAGQARESLKSVPASTGSSYSSSHSSSTASGYSYEDDAPKSKNMLSHLNSHSAMINYKVQAARSLVRKQEDLLRNLARMRENMERSENELGKASDYYSGSRHQSRGGYFERRAESAPLISRRQQVRDREVSPVISVCSIERTSDIGSEITPTFAVVPNVSSVSTHISATPRPAVSYSDYQPDEQFEREMAAIRKRVSNLSKAANEVTTPKYNSYDYDSSLTSNYLKGGYSDIYSTPESCLKVKNRLTKHAPVPRTYHSPLPPVRTSAYATKYVADDNDNDLYPRNSYSEYLMDSVNSLPDYSVGPTNGIVNHSVYDPELIDLYADPLSSGVGDCSLAY